MKLLEDRIRREGKIRPGGILKVDNFLNHQIDTALLFEISKEFKRLFGDERIDKVLTIEASGIAMASMTAYLFSVPLVFAKKSKTNRRHLAGVSAPRRPRPHHRRLPGHGRRAHRPQAAGGDGGRHRRRRGDRGGEGLPGRRGQAARRGAAHRIAGQDRVHVR